MKYNKEKYFDFSDGKYFMITTSSMFNDHINDFFIKMNLDSNALCTIKQIHSDKIVVTNKKLCWS